MFSMPITRRLPPAIMAIALGAIVVGACQAGTPASPPATSPPSPTAAATSPTPLGTITLTDTGCSWAGNPGSVRTGRMTVSARNSTDDYGLFIVHRLHAGKSWADGEALIAAIQEALQTGADWPPEVSEAITEMGAEAGDTTRLAIDLSVGTYGVVCSANTSSVGDILTVFLVGPLSVAP